MPCFLMHAAPALLSLALISQTGSRRVIPDQGLLCWRMPYLLFFSLGTFALWEPRLMCDDVYCLLICPFSRYQGPEQDRRCGGAIKGGWFRVILWFVRMIPHKTKKSHMFCPLPFRDMCGAGWGWWKNIGIPVNVFWEYEMCLLGPLCLFLNFTSQLF